VVLCLLSPATGKGADSATTLSLSNCIEMALNNATAAKKAKNTLKLQGVDVMRSYGSFLPQVSASAGYTPYRLSRSYNVLYTPPPLTKTTLQSADLTLTTSLNLFNGFRDYSTLQSALQRERAAEFTLTRALESVVFDVTQAYFQVLLDGELLDISRENLHSVQDQLTLTERQFQVGLKSMTDRYQQQAEVEESRLSAIKAETRMQRSMFELMRRLHIDPQTTIVLVPDPQEMMIPSDAKQNIEAMVAQAMERRGDLKSKLLETKAAEWQLKASRASWYPSIDVNFNLTSGGTEYLNGEYAYPPLSEQLGKTIGYSAGVRLNWLLFDGFQTRYAVQSSKITMLNQQLDYNDLHRNIELDLHQATGDYTSAFTQIETAKVSLTAATSAYNAVKRKYELGAASFVELSAARATQFNAKSNLSQARYNLALQKNVLDFATSNMKISQ